jgi:hypothetical protein
MFSEGTIVTIALATVSATIATLAATLRAGRQTKRLEDGLETLIALEMAVFGNSKTHPPVLGVIHRLATVENNDEQTRKVVEATVQAVRKLREEHAVEERVREVIDTGQHRAVSPRIPTGRFRTLEPDSEPPPSPPLPPPRKR